MIKIYVHRQLQKSLKTAQKWELVDPTRDRWSNLKDSGVRVQRLGRIQRQSSRILPRGQLSRGTSVLYLDSILQLCIFARESDLCYGDFVSKIQITTNDIAQHSVVTEDTRRDRVSIRSLMKALTSSLRVQLQFHIDIASVCADVHKMLFE